jgi:hypothetical protein
MTGGTIGLQAAVHQGCKALAPPPQRRRRSLMLITREWVLFQNDVLVMWKLYFFLTNGAKETGCRKSMK